MEGLAIVPDHKEITADETIKLNEQYVIGVTIENKSDSADVLTYTWNGDPITLSPGDRAREYGGFHACGIPGYYTGEIKIKWATTVTPKARVILTVLTNQKKAV